MKKDSKNVCPLCKRTGDFGLMQDMHNNRMCKRCYIEIYGPVTYVIETAPNISMTNDDSPRLKDSKKKKRRSD